MNTKSKMITGVAVAAGVGALALGGVSVANAAPGTATASPTAAAAPATTPVTGTPSAAPSTTATATPTSAAAPAPAAAPTASSDSDNAPLIYTALSPAEVTKLVDSDTAAAAALTPDQRAAKVKDLIAQSKTLPAHDPANVEAETVSIAIKVFATTN